MRKELLIATSMLFSLSSGVVQGACVTAPSCTELGFTRTASECPKGNVKCPWNTSLVYCKDNHPSCQIGWVYFEDNTCSAENTGNKKALGVVVYVNPDGIGGQVMSAWPVDENGNKSNGDVTMIWGDYNGGYYDIAALPNYTSQSSAATDFSSSDNTDKILADTQTTYTAARAARSYAPTTETKGKWCLPAAGVMTSIYSNQTAVQAGISKLGGVTYPSCCTWSSSEISDSKAWYSSFNGNNGLYNDHDKDNTYYVRPVLEF